jgi:hypothetical protein
MCVSKGRHHAPATGDAQGDIVYRDANMQRSPVHPTTTSFLSYGRLAEAQCCSLLSGQHGVRGASVAILLSLGRSVH